MRARRMARGRMDSAGKGFLRGGALRRPRRFANADADMRHAWNRWTVALIAHQHAMGARTL